MSIYQIFHFSKLLILQTKYLFSSLSPTILLPKYWVLKAQPCVTSRNNNSKEQLSVVFRWPRDERGGKNSAWHGSQLCVRTRQLWVLTGLWMSIHLSVEDSTNWPLINSFVFDFQKNNKTGNINLSRQQNEIHLPRVPVNFSFHLPSAKYTCLCGGQYGNQRANANKFVLGFITN